MGIKVTENKKPKLIGRDLAEAKRLEKLDAIRQKRLDKKNKKAKPSGLSMNPSIIKKRKSTKPKLTGRDLADAKRQEKLEVLKLKSDIKKALSKKNKKSDKSIKTSIRPKARLIKISVDNSGIPESKSILKAFNKLKKLLKMK
tara:strand:+ start:6 stop:434 length:429 start_codon:yes stop_codon:yes gene_type:complete